MGMNYRYLEVRSRAPARPSESVRAKSAREKANAAKRRKRAPLETTGVPPAGKRMAPGARRTRLVQGLGSSTKRRGMRMLAVASAADVADALLVDKGVEMSVRTVTRVLGPRAAVVRRGRKAADKRRERAELRAQQIREGLR